MPEEQKTPGKPLTLWQQALRAVKGDSTEQLMEQFTAEMTLVAEGLCEDMTRLQDAVGHMERRQDQYRQQAESQLSAMERTIYENQRDLDNRMNQLTQRMNAIERQLKCRKGKQADLITRLTVLVSIIAGAWVIVTALQLLK